MVNHQSAPTVAKALTSKLSISPTHSDLLAFCEVRTIGMEEMTFSTRRFLTVEKFRVCLLERREQGLPLDVLLIRKSSNIFARDIGTLKELVAVLCWDNREHRSDDTPPYNIEDYSEVYVPPKAAPKFVYEDPEDYYGWD
ncbi:hypothetical protein CPB83DRAFT_837269 [Crepidotus variabilis]|uniref:Uncharacterized protein n=1 Tax=Crepidotus variabilis TaxID=179855 RepID=A0A9P6JMT9_9AGAR|nr:hypothetical protein CPB83DRAFT_837269 [Crepidotus variabilis]